MSELLSSTAFWFGAVVLAAHQFAKFSELGSADPDFAARFPNPRLIDFAGKVPYATALAAFMAATLIIYVGLCSISPTILSGWAQVSGGAAAEKLTTSVDPVIYPLYIAAALIGFTQPGIPVLSNIGSMQRNFFHAWMGVPRRVMSTSSFFANQILTRSPDTRRLAKELEDLIGDAWRARIGAYADVDFYRAQLVRMKLEDEAELPKATWRELRILTRQLVDFASVATVRGSGVAALPRLARDLGVNMIPDHGWAKAFLAGGILFLVGMTLLWVLVPALHDLVAQLLSTAPEQDLWPKSIEFSGQYVMAQAGPILLATALALATWVSAFSRAEMATADRPRPFPGMAAHLYRYAGVLFLIALGVVLFDVCQAFLDYGTFTEGHKPSDFLAFVYSKLPFYLLHSFISLVACFVLLLYMDEPAQGSQSRKVSTVTLLAVWVALASLIYAAVRVQFEFRLLFGSHGVDFAVAIIVINVAAALMAFGCASLCKQQADASPDDAQPPARQDPRQTPVARQDTALAPAVPGE
jgi:hypothetical protein